MAMTVVEGMLLALGLLVLLALLAIGIALLAQGARRGRDLTALRDALGATHPAPGTTVPGFAASVGHVPGAPRVALVVNPIKIQKLHRFRRSAIRSCREMGHGVPLWLETTADDTGYGQALAALEEGAEIVIAAGGDGTVRAVAAALVGAEATMGIVPGGTGNLLARNIGVPIEDYDEALTAALTGDTRPVDVGWLRAGHSVAEASAAEREIFLVMAGLGFDASIMGETSDQVKKQFGWIAYVFSGARRILGASTRVTVASDDGPPRRLRARTVLLGNVGRLMGGIDLMPEARIDDGRLDALVLNWRGLAGFSSVVTALMNPEAPRSKRIKGLDRLRGTTARIEAEHAMPYELDGDPSGDAHVLLADIQPRALSVRFPLGAA